MSALLELRRITKRFGQFEAVGDVSLDVHPGEIVGLLGANGAGKSTLMRCALGIIAPSSGRSRIFGSRPSRKGRARLGYVPQGLGLYPDLTPNENLQFAAAAYGFNPAAKLEGHRPVSDLPVGKQRLLAFEIALGHAPELLVLDEPTSGVGPLGAARLWDLIGEQANSGVGVLVTTHNMAEAAQCDRLAVLVAGKLAAVGSLDSIVVDRRVVRVQTEQWQRCFDLLASADQEVNLAGREVRVLNSSIDRVQAILGELPATVSSVDAQLDEAIAMLAS